MSIDNDIDNKWLVRREILQTQMALLEMAKEIIAIKKDLRSEKMKMALLKSYIEKIKRDMGENKK